MSGGGGGAEFQDNHDSEAYINSYIHMMTELLQRLF